MFWLGVILGIISVLGWFIFEAKASEATNQEARKAYSTIAIICGLCALFIPALLCTN